jgi:hypothetical protein
MAKSGKVMIRRLVVLGLIAGVPTILGTWIGGFLYSHIAAIIFLSIGAGAIFQVVFAIVSWMAKSMAGSGTRQTLLRTSIVSGFGSRDGDDVCDIIAGRMMVTGVDVEGAR